MSMLEPRSGILKIANYVPGKSKLEGVAQSIKLSSNESSHGPCPAAMKAYEQVVDRLNRYSDGAQLELREAIADTLNLDADRIICGNGSDELIQLMVRAYVSEGDEALLSANGFAMSNIHCLAQGANLVIASEKDYRVDIDAMLERVTEKTRFCTIANPNNPTGTYINGDELRRLHAGLPKNSLFLIDDAYAEYVDREDYEDGTALVDQFDNVVMTRTFSKIHGLPSLRIGWAYCPAAVVDIVQRIRSPFNTNAAALAAATAAIQDTNYIAKIRRYNAVSLQGITEALTALGIEVVPSVANFYLVRFADNSGKSGIDAAEFLQSRGIIPRTVAGLEQFLRITVGLDHENEAVVTALTDYMNA